MKKRVFALLLCIAMVFSMVACGNANGGDTQAPPNTQTVEEAYVVTLPAHDDFSVMLSGNYAITDNAVLEYYYMVMYGADLGLEEVTDRDTVQDGDIVLVDYTGYLNGEAFTGGAATDQYIDVTNNCGVDTSDGTSSGSFIDGFTDGLVGAKVGETISAEVTFPEAYGNADLAGQLTTFEFNVKTIYRERTPDAITDEFVAENLYERYEVSTVDELMDFLEQDLAYVYVMNYLIYNSVVEIPETYLAARLDSYTNFMINYYGGEENLQELLSYYGMTIDQAKAEWAEELEAKITEEVVFKALVEQDGLVYDEEGHNAYIQSIIAINGENFPNEDSIYQYVGLGNSEAGKAYLLNQRAARADIIARYSEIME